MSFASLLNTAVTFQRKAATRDASGGQVENYADVEALTLVAACVQPRSSNDKRDLGQRQTPVTHYIYLEDAALSVRRGDRAYHPDTGRYFTCEGPEDMGGQGRAWRVGCTLLV